MSALRPFGAPPALAHGLGVLPAKGLCASLCASASLDLRCPPSPAVVSYVVLPVRARDLLTKKMASTLIKIGDMAVWLLGQARLSSGRGQAQAA